ncbi:hypothetical protein E2C01_085756 [Portunus trituberculatus]|uniref:Uncharacterized protein n=1 Tax=Portunus trituberculatus TaxID=210409 RepID=A0A5B7JCS6_PORTR|nr:hypothetical protein [Portunus trituberculatus]
MGKGGVGAEWMDEGRGRKGQTWKLCSEGEGRGKPFDKCFPGITRRPRSVCISGQVLVLEFEWNPPPARPVKATACITMRRADRKFILLIEPRLRETTERGGKQGTPARTVSLSTIVALIGIEFYM